MLGPKAGEDMRIIIISIVFRYWLITTIKDTSTGVIGCVSSQELFFNLLITIFIYLMFLNKCGYMKTLYYLSA